MRARCSIRSTSEGTDALLGFAFEWSFMPRWAVGIEASRYRTDAEDIDVLGGSIKFLW